MRTLFRVGILFLSVLAPVAVLAQDKQSQPAHQAPSPPPPPPAHSAPPPPAVHSAPPPQAVHAAPPPQPVRGASPSNIRTATSGERAAPREGAMPRGAMRDPSLVDPVSSASNEHNRGGGRGRDTSTATPSGTRVVSRTDSATRPAPIRNGSRTGSTERAVANGGRSRGDRPAYGVATARQFPPSHGGGGGHGGWYNPWYAPWYPYSFGFFYWDPLWWGASYPAYPAYDYGAYGGGSSSADYGYGSLKLKVKPNDAQVYVDGYFAGMVDDYDGVFQKLNLGVGPHHIEIRAEGYEPLEFDVQIQFDETTTYRGELKKP